MQDSALLYNFISEVLCTSHQQCVMVSRNNHSAVNSFHLKILIKLFVSTSEVAIAVQHAVLLKETSHRDLLHFLLQVTLYKILLFLEMPWVI